ncbi:MAG TPA: fumarylacetoacetate hydrolase family protein [Woeseiaceae bacterium]|jgi:2-keto-4-pentenoate hydratase/2-oxohepta-3-ene-1,7-dioic acid hydratase in catechol pathway|nr:fumarylacetoacetate hydrolase family protein [Woeseiaceae bacterium]
MKVASFSIDGRASYGIVRDGAVFEVTTAWRERYPDLRSVLAAAELPALGANCQAGAVAPGELMFLPLVPNPDKILCVGVNYRPHVEEMGREVPSRPVVFVRFAGSMVGHEQPLIRPRASEQYDFEGELAVVIGRPARHVARSDAAEYIAGYTCLMDGSVRDWQRHTPQFTPGKNFQQSGALGPVLTTRDEVPDPAQLRLETRVNGVLMQEGCVGDLIFDVPCLIEYCSTFAELLPGDVIATGTPGGVGAARRPPVWLRDGDRVEVDIDGIGCLANPVRDE